MESYHFESDDLQSTIHIGLYLKATLIGIAILFKNKTLNKSDNQIQIRGLAVLKEHKKEVTDNH